MGYTFFRAIKPEWELTACWQSILKSRRIMEPSQEEIAEMLEIGRDGFPRVDVSTIARKMGVVSIEHINNGEAENILRAVRGDIDTIVAYDGKKLTGQDRKLIASFGLWIDYNSRTDQATIQTPNSRDSLVVSLAMEGSKSRLIDCMQAQDDSRYGVYIVNTK